MEGEDTPVAPDEFEQKIARLERRGKLVFQAIGALFLAGAATAVVALGAWQQVRDAQHHLGETVQKVETKVTQVEAHTESVDRVSQENVARLNAAGAPAAP